ncbi:UNVERIFIED_ORG: hypothetical protein C7432_0044 [Pantoea allii]|nr:hypothetical protein SAMN03097714_0012 [Pantoea ananatis]
MCRARRGTGEQTGVSFPCLNSSPATVRARHFAVTGFRPQDGKWKKAERSDLLFRQGTDKLFNVEKYLFKKPFTN